MVRFVPVVLDIQGTEVIVVVAVAAVLKRLFELVLRSQLVRHDDRYQDIELDDGRNSVVSNESTVRA
jgi:hypothetical protein